MLGTMICYTVFEQTLVRETRLQFSTLDLSRFMNREQCLQSGGTFLGKGLVEDVREDSVSVWGEFLQHWLWDFIQDCSFSCLI